MFLSVFSEINDIFELTIKLIPTVIYQREIVDWNNKVGYINKLWLIKRNCPSNRYQ